MDCMSEKNILPNPGGPNSASFESETRDLFNHFKDDLRLRSHREKFNIDILAQNFFQSQYTCGEARKKFLGQKVDVKFFTTGP